MLVDKAVKNDLNLKSRPLSNLLVISSNDLLGHNMKESIEGPSWSIMMQRSGKTISPPCPNVIVTEIEAI